jgi:photosystem II stability/assembly factor-like uncharacterized protein
MEGTMNHLRGRGIAMLLACLAPAVLPAQEADDASSRPSVIAPLAPRALLLDLAWAGPRAVAVGERGIVLYSDDQGRSWTQVQVPASANLTAVYFVDGLHGWAVGHDEVVLRTEDGGLTWERTRYNPETNRPLLDVWFGDAERGLAVGAYGLVLSSADGGRSWTEVPFDPEPLGGKKQAYDPEDYDAEVDMGFDFHLNAVVPGPESVLYLAAEAGRLFRSDDRGATWHELPSPYDGSFYGIMPLDGDALLAYGLRGHVFRSGDGGQSWSKVETGTVALLDSAVRPSAGLILIAGLTGVMLVSTDGGGSFAFTQQDDRKAFSSLLWAGDGEVIVSGEGGVRRLAVPGLR